MVETMRRILSASHWGAYYARVCEGRIVGVEPFRHDPAPSPMIVAVPESVHSTCRVARPSIREGWLRRGPGHSGDTRGADRFVETSWEEALELVAAEIERVRAQHGNGAIFGGSYGWSSAGRFHHAKSQLSRFLNASGGCVGAVDNYSMGAAMVLLPHVLGSDDLLWRGMDWDVLAQHTDLIVSFGGLPLKNAQIDGGGMGEHTVEAQLRKLKARGTQFVLIGPAASDNPDFTQAEWIAARPTTDTALMLGLAATLLDEGLYDKAFIERCTVGFERFRAYLDGETGTARITPEWASQVTDVPAETIRQLARKMASRRTFITLSLSIQRSRHGEQAYWAGVVLAAMLGRIGLPGGGIGFGYSAANGMGNAVVRFQPPTLPGLSNPVEGFIPCARVADMLLNPGADYDYDGRRLTYPDIRLVYWCGGNPLHHHQDLNRLLGAFRRPDTLIVHEPWWTPFARQADIVLPATTTAERNDIMASRSGRHILAMKQAVAPVGQARDDFEIFRSLAARLGVEDVFAQGRSEMEWLEAIYESARAQNQALGIDMPEFSAFWADGVFVLPDPGAPNIPFADFRAEPDRHPLATPSGKIEIFSQTIDGFGYEDCPGHPRWMEPEEWLGAPAAARFPLHLITNQPATRLHSQLDMTAVGQVQKISGREPIWLNPGDAAARGVGEGDIVRVFNDRGACLAGARLVERLSAGVAVMATGGWYDPLVPGEIGALEKGGNPNVLTLDKGASRLSQACSAQTALVEVERWGAPLPPITAYDQPRFAPPPFSSSCP
ncbi:biotin/methionine sulfoxide reductase [Rhodoblastus acidophilus]|uniref:molybdopterin-dependent oxidoreductase n=1 Tax=Rhodoblastus acidophilus TaxID=1074 RepID=UPI0022252C30|nr:molybdopterin-dependent oxidoreductase [Rhodoblastus acidophilus]MCW2318668.1 biotin/methionine sulfoxide reductase [Rhodoblastus acidophilus]